MGTMVDEGEKKQFSLPTAGTIRAVCFGVWDLGFQKTTYNGEEKVQRKVMLGFELDEIIDRAGEYHGRRFCVFKTYTATLFEKSNLCKDLENWRGKAFSEFERKGFDLDKLIGVNALLSIIHNESKGKTYANIGSISALPKGMETMKVENGPTAPEWIVKIQNKAVEVVNDGGAASVAHDEPIPF